MTTLATQPVIQLYPYQQRWLADHSRFKVGNWARQVGKSFVVALEAVDDAMETGQDWVLLSAGERQSKELVAKAAMHVRAYTQAAAEIEQDDFWVAGTRYTILTLHLPNGARIMGLPANPDTARGFSANVIIDEFGVMRDSHEIWKALLPTISRGYRIRVVGTPKGIGNRFHQLVTGDNDWSKHTVDIYTAVAEGAPHHIDELRAGIDDPDAWEQEFGCLFIDDASAWLTYEMITACQDENCPQEIAWEDVTDDWIERLRSSMRGRAFGGLDIGRRRDLTVLDIEDQVGDVFWQRAMIVFPAVRITEQKHMLWRLLRERIVERVCIDATGMGLTIGEDTVEEFGFAAEAVTFSSAVKQDLAVRSRNKFEDRLCRIPIDRKLRDDLHAVKKTTTAAGNVRFDAERTDLGHADRFWAKSLAFMASDEGAVKPEIFVV